ncbi:MAG TPA: TadE/TadG family type IV pilus assembly protein [Casimicrobiaceae bacterium]|jgi:Flp pilus assembly protein TadG|nr:TadE/TadG family type IV pilus assembly protein [Casimicrobiaceae bacterium]
MDLHRERLPSVERGAAIVEFAIVLSMMLLITAGIFEFGRAFQYYDALAKATRDGARYMSAAPKATINSVAVSDAKNLVVTAANAANVAPALTITEVVVTCTPAACADGTAPTDVEVSITGYSINIGGVMPFVSGTTSYSGVTLAPHTTMRYMN